MWSQSGEAEDCFQNSWTLETSGLQSLGRDHGQQVCEEESRKEQRQKGHQDTGLPVKGLGTSIESGLPSGAC